MVGEVGSIGVSPFFWGANAYLATKYRIKYRIEGRIGAHGNTERLTGSPESCCG